MFYREAGQFKSSYAADQAIFPIAQDRIFVIAVIVAAFALPLVITNDYWYNAVLIPLMVFSMAALGLNVLVGYCGQISLGTGGFMAVGGYAAFKLTTVYFPDLGLIFIFLMAGGVAALVGLLFGIPSLRIKGFYLAVATLAAQFFLQWLFNKVPWFANFSSAGTIEAPPRTLLGKIAEKGGTLGFEFVGCLFDTKYIAQPIAWLIKKISFGWWQPEWIGHCFNLNPLVASPRASPENRYLFGLALVIVFAFIVKNLVRGRMGRAWMAIRDMDVAAQLIGIRPLQTKLSAFAVSSFVCGVAGAMLLFQYLGAVETAAYDINVSFQILFMVIIGGLGSVMGSFLGAGFIVLVPIFLVNVVPAMGIEIDVATRKHIELMLFGGLMIFFLIVEPHGLARFWQIAKEKLRLWPFPH